MSGNVPSQFLTVGGFTYGDSIPATDDSFEILQRLTAGDAYRMVRALVPDAVTEPNQGVRARDIRQDTIDNGSVCRAVWKHRHAVVIGLDNIRRRLLVIDRVGREFSLKVKQLPPQ